MIQREALDILKTGVNVFITGPAGSGKTHVVNQYISYLKEHGVPTGITASTGIAATHMGGMTIHSWSGIGVKDDLTEHDLESIFDKAGLRKRMQETKVLIIDEVSMLHHFRLDLIDQVLKHVRKSDKPFGGLQVVLCGDFFQLPPVSRYGDRETHFIYRSKAWHDGKFTVCYLSENYRQVDDISLTILNEIRSGEVSDEAREHLQSRHNVRLKEEVEAVVEIDGGDGAKIALVEPTRLYTHNADVDAINERELGKVNSPEFVYEMRSTGRKPLVDGLKKSCLAPETLRLRKGARVMCVKNNFDKGYVNGTLGVVVSCGPGLDPTIITAPSREHPQGERITIEQASWRIEDEGRVIAEINQYPLRLAWAITVHKSQGMSLDAIEVDLSRSFEPGMGYVALSRVRTLAGLTILGMNEAALQVHPEVLKYDRNLRTLSDKAQAVLSGTDATEIARAQNEFLAQAAPMHKMGKKGGKKGGSADDDAEFRGYRSGKTSTFDITAGLLLKKKSLKEIATARDIVVETVIDHIERLISDETVSQSDIAYLKHEISAKHFKKIEIAMEEVSLAQTGDAEGKPPLLSPVKSKVGASVSFKDIRLARVLLGYVK
jgi:ATP-dependent exoDNAse (exonuclease V) alpha subunit